MECGNSVEALLRQYALISGSLNKQERGKMLSVCRSVGDFVRGLLADFMDKGSGHPVLIQYCQDTTPARMRATNVESGKTLVNKSGKMSLDVCVQFLVYTRITHDGPSSLMVLSPGIPLYTGKKQQTLARCVTEQPLFAALETSTGVMQVRHQVYDRGVGHRLADFVSGLWAASVDEDDTASEVQDGCSLQLHTQLYCAQHDAHNAIKWSQSKGFTDKEFLKRVFVSFSVFRAATFKAVHCISSWLLAVVLPVPEADLPSYSALSEMWMLLDVPEAEMEVLLEFGAHWREGRLRLNSNKLHEPAWCENFSSCLLGMWSISQFSEGRWGTLGKSCRSLARCVLTGYMSFFQHMLSAGWVSEYEHQGCKKMASDELLFTFVVALSCMIPERLVMHLFLENRLAMNQQSWYEELLEQLRLVQSISEECWELLAENLPEVSTAQFKNEVLSAALVSLCFLEFRVFQKAAQYPWFLCSLPPEDAFQSLLLDDTVTDDRITTTLQRLARAGFGKQNILDTLVLLSECSWTSEEAERMHASHACVKKYHAEMGLEASFSKAYLHGVRQFLPESRDNDEKHLQKLRQQLGKLLKARPQNITGRQAYLARSMSVAQSTLHSKDKKVPGKRVMSNHSTHWQALSATSRRSWEEEAKFKRAEAREHNQNKEEELETRIDIEEQRMQQESMKRHIGPSMSRKSCRWTSEQ
eukprot:6461292-Amphidinium_carterae.1